MERRQHARHGSARRLRSTGRDLRRAVVAAALGLALGPVGIAVAECLPPGPQITMQPTDKTVTVGEHAVFEASAFPYESLQWQVSTEGGANPAPVPGANAETFTIEKTGLPQNGWEYRALFVNTSCTATSEWARLSVNVPPAITTQ